MKTKYDLNYFNLQLKITNSFYFFELLHTTLICSQGTLYKYYNPKSYRNKMPIY